MDFYTSDFPSPIGVLRLLQRDGALVALRLPGQPPIIPEAARHETTPLLRQVHQWLSRFFAGEDPGTIPVPLQPEGSAFSRLVWQELLAVPYGSATTYGALASRVAAAMGKQQLSAQAVGSALGRNPIPILIPCHRVLGKDGSLIGYAGGLGTKRQLLTLEGIPYREEKR